ncbi:helix-hairpin-helix domain-containing protein [Sunxiuqinia sp. sy24]|uniref:helix-hairpin-helix domain-containing protein n=1 Tax=Sunxiuqinia sp. sy24 TaxID=3461495 RepID=UPI004045FEF7
MKRILFLLLGVWLSSVLVAQPSDFDLYAELEGLVESVLAENENADVEQLMAELQQMKENPFNINQAGREDFQRLYFLSAMQIDQLLRYREQYGQIFTPFELNTIEGFDPKLIQVLQAFVVFGDTEIESPSFWARQELMIRAIRLVEEQKGFKEPAKYEGSPEKLYLRYRFSSANIRAGLTSEKDAGESFFRGSNPKGFDYYSGFVNVGLGQEKHQLYLGDYLVRFGQGLTAWQGFSLSKSAEVSRVGKFNQGIRAYSSTDENNYLRGLATSFSMQNWTWHTFVSYKNFDANRDSIDGEAVFTSFQSSGLHRTESEIEDKNSVSGLTTGVNLNYAGKHFSVGLSGIHFRYELPLARKEAAYNLFLFEGKQLSNLGLNYQWGMNRYFFFGEAGCSSGGGLATIHGVQANPADAVEYSMIYRNISKKYQAPLAGAFTEGSQVNDEQGLYLGVVVRPAAKLSLRMYADFFEHRWVKYTTVAPARGREYLVQGSYQLSNKWEVYSRYFNERKPVKVSGAYTKMNLDQTRQKLRVHVSGALSERFFLKSRIEWVWYEHDETADGWLVYQDFGYKSVQNKTNWWLRLAYFKTDNYDSRVYAYENDLLYQFSVPAFYGEGIRFYLNGKVKICENVEGWIKASRSWFLGVNSIGSGYSQIDGNQRTEVKFQLRFKF